MWQPLVGRWGTACLDCKFYLSPALILTSILPLLMGAGPEWTFNLDTLQFLGCSDGGPLNLALNCPPGDIQSFLHHSSLWD